MRISRKKKRVGTLYGKPVVEGPENELKAFEIIAKKENDYITLAAKNKKGGEIKSLSTFSSIGENYGDCIMAVNQDIYFIKTKLVINPKTLKDVFCLDFIRKSDDKATISFFIQSSLDVYLVDDSYLSADQSSWKDKDSIRQCLLNLCSSYNSDDVEHKYIFNNIRAVPLFFYISGQPEDTSIKFAFKNGCIQGAFANKGANMLIHNMFTESTISGIAVKTNYKGDEVQDTFHILGTSVNTEVPYMDSSHIALCRPILLISPFVNALFAVAIKSDDNTLVLVNCLDINTSFLRKLYGISEYAVIPAPKEGEYIEASLLDTADTMELSSKEPNSFLLGKLKSSLESLIENIEVNTETKAVVD